MTDHAPKDQHGADSASEGGGGSLSHEKLLKLAIFDKIPFTIWACTRDFKIVLWNRTSEEKYAHTAAEALGKDYVELFVDDLEKEASRADCTQIIEKDERFKNFLAYDHAGDGSLRTMLTNCFRVYDESRRDYLQVEVGVSADELNMEVERERLHSLRDLAKQRREERARAKEAAEKAAEVIRDTLLSTVTERLDHKNLRLELRRDKVSDLRSEVNEKSKQAVDMTAELGRIDEEIRDNRAKKLRLIKKVRSAGSIEELYSIHEELDADS